MWKCLCLSFILTSSLFLVGCVNHRQSSIRKIQLADDIEVSQLDEGVWLHTTYYEVPNLGRYPANGLIVISEGDCLMIDLPWTDGQTKVVFDWIKKEQGATVKIVVPTHSHTDCVGGLAEAHKRGADSWAFAETIEKLEKEKREVPKHGFLKTKELACGDIAIELDYLGGGHTTDNIVAWIPNRKILFGGCLVKSMDAKNLGNTNDAALDSYPKTLKAVLQKFPDAKVVVPGHGEPGGLQLVKHTIELCNISGGN